MYNMAHTCMYMYVSSTPTTHLLEKSIPTLILFISYKLHILSQVYVYMYVHHTHTGSKYKTLHSTSFKAIKNEKYLYIQFSLPHTLERQSY